MHAHRHTQAETHTGSHRRTCAHIPSSPVAQLFATKVVLDLVINLFPQRQLHFLHSHTQVYTHGNSVQFNAGLCRCRGGRAVKECWAVHYL